MSSRKLSLGRGLNQSKNNKRCKKSKDGEVMGKIGDEGKVREP